MIVVKLEPLRRLSILATMLWLLSACGGGGSNALSNIAQDDESIADATRLDGVPFFSPDVRLKSFNPGFDHQFGSVVASSANGDVLIVTAPNEDSYTVGVNSIPYSSPSTINLSEPGALYVFERNASGEWEQSSYIKASTVSREFGASAALSADGSRIIVGVPNGSGTSYTDPQLGFETGVAAGQVYIFDRDEAGDWQQTFDLVFTQGKASDRMGESVAISADGRVFLASAPGRQYGTRQSADDILSGPPNSGAIHVFNQGSDSNLSSYLLRPSETELVANRRFGQRIAMSSDGQTLAVTNNGYLVDPDAIPIAGGIPVGREQSPGFITIYEIDETETHRASAHLLPVTESSLAGYGASLAMSADGLTVAVGSTYPSYSDELTGGALGFPPGAIVDVPAGVVTVYSRDDSGWNLSQTIPSPVTRRFWERFGSALTMTPDGNLLVVGMTHASALSGGVDAGAAFVYDRIDGRFVIRYGLTPKGGGRFGQSLQVSDDGRQLIVGMPKSSSGGAGIDPPSTAEPISLSGETQMVYLD